MDGIDIFTESIIRKQFGIISAFNAKKSSENNFIQSAILLTAIESRFHYIIHKGADKNGCTPICFTVINNTADKVSNRHWEKLLCNFANAHNQRGLIVGYDNVILTDPLCVIGNQPLFLGTIRMLKADAGMSRLTKGKAKYIDQSDSLIASYAELLSCYGTLIGGDPKIKFSVGEPSIKRDCPRKVQPFLTEKNISAYYETRKHFNNFYSNGYYNFASSPPVMERAKEQLRRLVNG